MIKGRRVGTFTTGIVLVLFGIMFLLRLINPSINYLIIASMWPWMYVNSVDIFSRTNHEIFLARSSHLCGEI